MTKLPAGGKSFASKSRSGKAGLSEAVANTTSSGGTTGNNFKNAAKSGAKPSQKNKKRRRLVIAGSAVAIGGVAVTLTDEAKHATTAVQRSNRVLSTLVLNIRE